MPGSAAEKRVAAFTLLTYIGMRHEEEIFRSATSPGVYPNNAEGYYSLRGFAASYIRASISIPESASTSEDLGRFDFRVSIGYDLEGSCVDVYGPLSGSPKDICLRVSKAIELAKNFKSEESLRDFLRGASSEAWQQSV